MSTTTIRLTDELKARVARAAQAAGTTAHGFIVEAIADKAAMMEQRADFHTQAQERFDTMGKTGKAIPWSDVRSYLQQRAEGLSPARPRARRLAAPETAAPVPAPRGSARRKA
jgi:predicted transcriptional regulator